MPGEEILALTIIFYFDCIDGFSPLTDTISRCLLWAGDTQLDANADESAFLLSRFHLPPASPARTFLLSVSISTCLLHLLLAIRACILDFMCVHELHACHLCACLRSFLFYLLPISCVLECAMRVRTLKNSGRPESLS